MKAVVARKLLPEESPNYSIADDLNTDSDTSRHADPMTEFLTNRSHVRAWVVQDTGLSIQDFEDYVDELQKRREYAKNISEFERSILNTIRLPLVDVSESSG